MSLEVNGEDLPLIDQLSEEGFVDLTFRILDLTDNENHYSLKLRAFKDDETFRFAVNLVKGIQGGFDDEVELIQEQVHSSGVIFFHSGDESDRMINFLARAYGSDTPPKGMVKEESFTAIALHQGELDFKNECIKLKLFGRDEEPFEEDDYYESFFNVDLANKLVFWNEKDSDYREPLLRALGDSQ